MGRSSLGLGIAVGCAVATCTVAAVLVARGVGRRRRWARAVAVLRDFEEGCATPTGRLRQVVDAMAVEMHAGLASDGGSKLKMLLTHVDRLPKGCEEGVFYALDLGGTNFRVLRVKLVGKSSSVIQHEVQLQVIPQHLMTSTSEDLFDFIAATLKEFVDKEDTDSTVHVDRKKQLGFTFSFPLRQTSISAGALIEWTKGFSINDTVDKDVSMCLEKAMEKIGIDMRVAVLVNDTVGTLALGHYLDEDTVAAVIIGTGTNACYVERTDAIIKSQGLFTDSGTMVVNMEWGNFWSSHLPRTSYDVELDEERPNRNGQGFEKMISGMYLGEIVRRVIHRMAQEYDIFGCTSENLSKTFILRTPMMAAMHEDDSSDLAEVARILREALQISEVPVKTRRLVIRVCDTVTRRAARLVAAGIVGILKKIGRDGSGGVAGGRVKGEPRRTVVAVEGGLYANYFMFREYLHEAVDELLGDEVAPNVILKPLEDGSGIGSALLAAAYSSQ